MDSPPPSIDPTTTALICLALTITFWILQRRSSNQDKKPNDIPNAIGGTFLLGNALQYKQNPTQCIRDQEKQLDSKLFRLNLAGRSMVIVGSDPSAMKQVAAQPESVFSSCRAVAEIGFEYTLGTFNVYEGTAWHKSILKNYIAGDTNQFLPSLYQTLVQALEVEINHLNQKEGPDLFIFTRRCILRATLDELVSPLLLQKDPELLTVLMEFQDQVEDTTAKAAVLPRWLALPTCLWPTQKARKAIEKRIVGWLPAILETANGGPWVQAYAQDQTTPSKAAEHLIGLIFAAHKNPSIGAAQSFCLLKSELTREQQDQAQQEAKTLCQQFAADNKNNSLTEALLQAKTLRTCVLETMRLTAHTLGALRYANQSLDVQMTNPKRSYTIRQGETVSLAHHTMHMEPSLWGQDAERFSLNRPEWNSTPSSLGIPVDHYKLTAFSNGTHKCPGEKIALAMMQLQLALLLVNKAQLVGDNLPPVSFERATLAQRDGPVAFRIGA